jgi:putative MATE family efflux protein
VVVNVVLIAVTASVDAHFIGQLGPGALAGLALVFPVVMLMQQMANGSMGGAIASAIARALGAGRRDDAGALVVHGLAIALVMASLFATAVLVGGPTLFHLMGGSGDMLAVALAYSTPIFAGAAVFWILGALTSVVRGAGQAAALAAVYLAAEALHVALVPALVFGIGPVPALGPMGAGLATIASYGAAAVALAWYVASGRTAVVITWRRVRLERRLFVEIVRVGLPASLTPILGNVTLAVLTGLVTSLGPAAVAGFGAAARLEYVQVPVTFGLGVGVLAMVGTSIGAAQFARAARVAWTAAGLAMATTACFSALALGWPGAWIGLFSADAAVHEAGIRVLRIVGIGYPFLGLGFAMAYAFQAAGRPLWPLLAMVFRVVVIVAAGAIAVRWADGGLLGLAAVAAAGLLVHGGILALAFRAGAWRPAASARPA